MASIQYIESKLSKICPINGVSIGNKADKTTWRIDYKNEATQAQRQSADSFIAQFDVNAPEVPETVQAWQARVVIEAAGLKPQADLAISTSDNLMMKTVWEYGNVFHRDSPAINALGAALGLTSKQIDDLFIAAASLEV